MKQKRNITPIILITIILVLGGLSAYLFNEQSSFQAEIDTQQTAEADLRATLVQVFEQQRAQNENIEAAVSTRESEIAQLQTAQAALEPIATAAAAQADLPTPTPQPVTDVDQDAPPQVRIILRDRENVRPAGEAIDIIVSAAHPIGIAAVNVTVNGETLLVESPFDPRMSISTVRWTPLEAGEYTIAAAATTIRGRTADPVSIDLFVLDESDPQAVNESILRRIEAQVEELRGRTAQSDVTTNFITRAELRENIETDLLADYTPADADIDVWVLSMFDFIPADYPLYESLVETYTDAIAGYYDPEQDAMYVLDEDGELDQEEKLTHAHEYMHALQDQFHDLSRLTAPGLTRDQRLALRSLGEGEAELLEFLFETRGYLTGEQAADSDPVAPTPVSENTPSFLLSDFSFPYVQGFSFVSYFYNQGQFSAVNDLWANEPVSTEQILHPERYANGDQPQPVTLPDLLPVLEDSWFLVEEGRFGEFYLREYLQQWLETQDEIDTAATGWGGDRYAVYRADEDGEQVLTYKLVWDTPADQKEFESAYESWANARMGTSGRSQVENGTCWTLTTDTICLYSQPDQFSLIIRAETAERATTIAPVLWN